MDTNSGRIALIMTGGSGERFWPLSRRSRPKQLLCLTGRDHTLLEHTVLNISLLIPRDRIFLATAHHLADIIRDTQKDIPPENIFAEPFKRNTAGCLVFVAAHLLARYGGDGSDITMAVLPADHNIVNPERFREIVDAAMTAAEKENALVTLGIKPDRPETGYGYLELSPQALPWSDGPDKIPVFPVVRFCEKPDRATAEDYISTGKFFWNSGMFFWCLSTFVRELGQASPEMADTLKDLTDALEHSQQSRVQEIFEGIENISIDYALMEKAKRVLAIKADFGWDDVGAWDALDRSFPRDKDGNVTVGEPVLIDSKNCIVYNDSVQQDVAVAVIGVEGLAVIVSADGVLVVPKERAQDVRTAVEELKRRGAPQV